MRNAGLHRSPDREKQPTKPGNLNYTVNLYPRVLLVPVRTHCCRVGTRPQAAASEATQSPGMEKWAIALEINALAMILFVSPKRSVFTLHLKTNFE